MDFEQAVSRLLRDEGGLSMDPRDRGNWTSGKPGIGELRGTKFGISAAAYPTLDIANLTEAQARAIYLADYWKAVGCDVAPEAVRDDLFDTAVNSGPLTAALLLQRAVGVRDDGVVGPVTRAAVATMEPGRLIARFHGHRLHLLVDVPTWNTYGRGWTDRVAKYLMEA